MYFGFRLELGPVLVLGLGLGLVFSFDLGLGLGLGFGLGPVPNMIHHNHTFIQYISLPFPRTKHSKIIQIDK